MILTTRLGALTLHAVEDGWYHTDPLASFPGSTSAAWEAAGVTGRLRVRLGCFVVVDGERVVMVDSGMGSATLPAEADAVSGRLPQALERLGIPPTAVEAVIHTHLHVDHCGGDRAADGRAFFPEARLVAHQADMDHFSADESWLGEHVRREFLPFVAEGRVDIRTGGGKVVPGITVEETPGHTPGHMSVVVASGDDEVLIGGDVSHHPVQVAHPGWSSAGDVDPEQAAVTRTEVLARLAATGVLFAAGHYPHPWGRVASRDGTLHWEPDVVGEP